MAGPSVLFELHTDPPIEGMRFALDRAADNVSDFTSLLEGFGEIFRGHMTRQFVTEGSLAGGWADLSEPYATWKAEHYPGRPIGVLSGALRSAMTGSAGYEEKITSDEASYGMSAASSATPYGKYFAGGGRGPARPVIQWGSAQSRDYQKFAHEWLIQALAVAIGKTEAHARPNVHGVL
jgi:hypothetical protein